MVILFRQTAESHKLKSTVKDVESLSKVLKVLRKIWLFLGSIPAMGTSKVSLRLQQSWCLFLLLLIWCVCLHEIRYTTKRGTTITKAFYSLEMFYYIFVVSSVFYNTFVNKYKLIKIYNRFVALHEQLERCHSGEIAVHPTIYRQLKNEILFVAFWHVIFYTFCVIINITRFRQRPLSIFRILCVYYVPNILISANFCLFWVALRVISLSYCYTNKLLRNSQRTMKSWQTSNNSIWFKKEFCTYNLRKPFQFFDDFQTLTEIRTSLDQLMRDVIEMFSIILILNFCNSFVLLSVQYFALYKFFDSKDVASLLVFVLKFARIAMHIFNIGFTLFTNHFLITEKCKTIYILNSLPVDSLEMEKTISNYLMQLMVRKHTVWVCDIFELDLTFLLSIISALSTYVIFLIQIDLGSVTIEGKAQTPSG